MFNNYPYTDYHELNTDWIIGKIKNVETSEANAKQYAEDADAAKIAAQDAQTASEDARDASVDAKDAAVRAKDDAIDYLNDTRDQLDLLQARVDNIIPDGTQTAGNTELLDIRVAYDGKTWTSAGDAVRGQCGDLKDDLNNLTDTIFTEITSPSYNNYSTARDGATLAGNTITIPAGSAGYNSASGLEVTLANYAGKSIIIKASITADLDDITNFNSFYNNTDGATDYVIDSTATTITIQLNIPDGTPAGSYRFGCLKGLETYAADKEFTVSLDSIIENPVINVLDNTEQIKIIKNKTGIVSDNAYKDLENITITSHNASCLWIVNTAISMPNAFNIRIHGGTSDTSQTSVRAFVLEKSGNDFIIRYISPVFIWEGYFEYDINYQCDANKEYFVAYDNLVFSLNTSYEGLIETYTTDTANAQIGDTVTSKQVRSYTAGCYFEIISSKHINYIDTMDSNMMKCLFGELHHKSWLLIGDSITEENSRANKRYFDWCADLNSNTIVNFGLSGSGYVRAGGNNQYVTSSNFYQRLSQLPASADLITVLGGVNDYMLESTPLGDITDSTPSTVSGLINLFFDGLVSQYPVGTRIAIFTPLPCEDCSPDNEVAGPGGYTMGQLSDRIIEAANNHGLPVFDLYRCSGIYPGNPTSKSNCIPDGIHPNDAGHARIWHAIFSFINTL